MYEQASIADVQALDDLLDSMPDLHRAMIERALDARVQDKVNAGLDGWIDADDHERVVAERDSLEDQVVQLMNDLETERQRNVTLEAELAEKTAALAQLQGRAA